MSLDPTNPSRRDLIGGAIALGVNSLLPDSAAAAPLAGASRTDAVAAMPPPLRSLPDRVFIEHDGSRLLPTERSGDRFSTSAATVTCTTTSGGTEVSVTCPRGPLSRVVLRWDRKFPANTLFLGDHWERGYGDLQWQTLHPDRLLPWYFAAHHASAGETFLAGVKTQPSAICFWMVDAAGVSLWLDLRNGGGPSVPGDRVIPAATIVSRVAPRGETPMAALTAFCKTMCPAPRLAMAPICGNNNWYYAYGQNFDADAMRRDAAFLADISSGHKNRPYCVIDAGWTPGSSAPGGPWREGKPGLFPDMKGLANDMKKLGVRPGIWIRPTALTTVDDPRRLRAGPSKDPEKPLDLTMPENLALIHDDVARVRGWGYELIKHDFSTYDIFARWGFEMGAEFTDGQWNFADRSRTNAEIILTLYRTLREAAGDAVLLGCNTIGHLGAGLFEIQRTGDDTSGRVWERTRKMGINTLAFRLPQHGTFFASDPDCAAHTEFTPWELDRQFLDLVARSGTALFISVDPRTVTPEQKGAFRAAMQIALSGGTPGGCEPLDWLTTTTPRVWRLGTETVTYRWEGPSGPNPRRA